MSCWLTILLFQLKWSCTIIGWHELKGTHKEHGAEPALHGTTRNSNLMRTLSRCSLNSCNSGQCPLPRAACAMPTAFWCRTFPQPPPGPPWHSSIPFTQVLSLSPKSRAQLCRSTTCEELQAAIRPLLILCILNICMSFLYWGVQTCTQCSTWDHDSTEQSRILFTTCISLVAKHLIYKIGWL